MKPYRKLWWRILGGCLVGLWVLANAGMMTVVLVRGRGHLVSIPPHVAITCRVEATDARPVKPGQAGEIARACTQRLEMDVQPVAGDRIEVRVPLTDGKPVMPIADVTKLLGGAGRLEFRVAPYHPQTGEEFAVAEARLEDAVDSLAQHGPEPLQEHNADLLWFPIRGERRGYGKLVVGQYEGKDYLLLYNRPEHVLLRGADAGAWTVAAAYVDVDAMGAPAVWFQMDAAGAKRFTALTGAHIGHSMAILVDDVVYSAPTIQCLISKEGQITGSFTAAEADELAKRLRSIVLPAQCRLRIESIRRMGPADPPHATTKRVLLCVLGAAAALLLVTTIWAAVKAWPHLFGPAAILLIAAGQLWWQTAAWENYNARNVPAWALWNTVTLGVVMAILWLAAGVPASRRERQ